MSRFRRFDIIEHSPSLFLGESFVATPKTLLVNPFYPSFPVEGEHDFALDLVSPNRCPLTCFDFPSLFDDFGAITDVVEIERNPFYTSTTRRVQHGVGLEIDLYLQCLSDRVSALELSFDRLVKTSKPRKAGDRKYTWTAEIKAPEKDGFDRKYKWIADVTGGKNKEKRGGVEKNYKCTAEIKGKGDNSKISRTYTFKASSGDVGECSGTEKKDKKKKTGEGVRLVEIEEASDHEALVLRQAFANRAGSVQKRKGKKKELSPQDAAMVIQRSFREYLIRRSQALRALRELAIAKTKLKEIRTLFNNFTYRRRVARDAEERQRFSEKIIVLLLTVDAIEGADMMVRAAKKSMVDELEAMLDVVDPQPGKFLSMRRTFDVPDGVIQKELAAGVAQVVQMIDQERD